MATNGASPSEPEEDIAERSWTLRARSRESGVSPVAIRGRGVYTSSRLPVDGVSAAPTPAAPWQATQMDCAGPDEPSPSATTPMELCGAALASGTRSYQYQLAPAALDASVFRYTAYPTGVVSVTAL